MIQKTLILFILAAGPVYAGSCCEVKRPASYTSESIFHLKSSWTNQADERVHIDALEGRWHVAAMFFASCSSICPRLVSDIKHIEKSLPEEVRNEARFVLISLDPSRDTPEALRDYMERMELDESRWALWRGHPRDTRALAAALGVAYRILPNGDVSHAAPILLLNPDGEIVMRLDDFTKDREPLVDKLSRVLNM